MVGSWRDQPRTAGSSYSDGVLHRYFFRVALLIFTKSVADFPKIGGSFSQSVADFPKLGG